MKRISLILIPVLFLFVGCKESTTEPEPEKINDKYYVIKDGASLVYYLSITDSNNFTLYGNRYLDLNDSTILGSTNYKIQSDSFETFTPFDTLKTTVFSYIRQSNGGVFTYADTTGFTGFLPDSLRQYLTVDRESRLLFYPLSNGQKFPVFTLSLSAFIVGINVIDVDAEVESTENISLIVNNTSTDFIAYKIKYTFIIRTGSNPEDENKYTAYGWAVKDLGFIKWDGDAEVFNFLLNENIFPPETNVKMNLTDYQF